MSRPAHIPKGLWDAYVRAHVEVDVMGGRVTIRPGDPLAEVLAAFVPFCVITAWNPRGEPRSASENATLHQTLVEWVSERGISHWPARGRDPYDSSHIPEEGLALIGLGEWEAAAWGAGFGQLAVFRITDSGLTVLPIAPRRSERPVHYLWVYDPTREHVEVSRDYARPLRDRRHHEELAELVERAPDRIHGTAFVKPFGYRIFDINDEAVERAVGERIVRAIAALEIEEGFCLP